MKLIQWDEVESWVFIKNKKRLLLLLKGGDTNLDVQITVPERYSRDVQNLMLRMLPDKQIKNG